MNALLNRTAPIGYQVPWPKVAIGTRAIAQQAPARKLYTSIGASRLEIAADSAKSQVYGAKRARMTQPLKRPECATLECMTCPFFKSHRGSC